MSVSLGLSRATPATLRRSIPRADAATTLVLAAPPPPQQISIRYPYQELVVVPHLATGLLNLVHHHLLFRRLFISTTSQLHGMATATVNSSNERMLN